MTLSHFACQAEGSRGALARPTPHPGPTASRRTRQLEPFTVFIDLELAKTQELPGSLLSMQGWEGEQGTRSWQEEGTGMGSGPTTHARLPCAHRLAKLTQGVGHVAGNREERSSWGPFQPWSLGASLTLRAVSLGSCHPHILRLRGYLAG